MFVLPFLIWKPVFLPMKIEANWLLSSSAHSLLMSTVFCLLTGDHTSPCHLTLVHVHLKANGRNGVPLFSSLSVQVASYCDFLISFGIPHPTIHPLSQKHGNLPGFLPFPHLPHGTNQLSIPAPVYLTDPVLPISIAITVAAPFLEFLLYLALPSPPATTFHTITTSLMWSCPFLRGFMATVCLQEKVQTKAQELVAPLCLCSLSPASPPTPTDCLSLPSYLQFCMSPSFFLQSLLLSLHVCLTVSSSLLTWLCDPFKTSLLWECFPNPLSSPGLIQTSLVSVFCV